MNEDSSKTLTFFLWGIFLTFLQGCVAHKQYRHGSGKLLPHVGTSASKIGFANYFSANRPRNIVDMLKQLEDPGQKKPAPSFLVSARGSAALSIIEFDDMGELWDRNQLKLLLEFIEETRNQNKKILLFGFVHGWKHNASDDSTNLRDFASFIDDVSNNLNVYANPAEIVPIGMYIAWRGNVVDKDHPIMGNIPVIGGLNLAGQQLSFYNRKAAAARVGGASATEVFLSVAGAVKTISEEAENPREGNQIARIQVGEQTSSEKPRLDASRVVFIGHSMGGLILERAVSQALLGTILVEVPLRQERKRQLREDYKEAGKIDQKVIQLKEKNAELIRKRSELTVDLKMKEEELSRIEKQLMQNLNQRSDQRVQIAVAKAAVKVAQDNARENFHTYTNTTVSLLRETSRSGNDLSKSISNAFDGVEFDVDASNVWRRVISNLSRTLEPIQCLGQNKDAFGPCYSNVTILVTRNSSILNAQQSEITDGLSLLENEKRSAYNKLEREIGDFREKFEDLQVEIQSLWSDYQNSTSEVAQATNRVSEEKGELSTLIDQQKKLEDQVSDLTNSVAQLNVKIQANELLIRSNITRTSELVEASHILKEATRANYMKLLQRPADLILLLNPASEAIMAKKMKDAFNSAHVRKAANLFSPDADTNDENPVSARPWIISVSSKGDSATRTIFPAAMWLSSTFKVFRGRNTYRFNEEQSVSQVHLWKNTATHLNTDDPSSSLITHTLMNANSPSGSSGPLDSIKRGLSTAWFILSGKWAEIPPHHKTTAMDMKEIIREHKKFEKLGKRAFSHNEQTYELKPVTRGDKKNAYWIIQADEALIRDHNHIFNKDFFRVVFFLLEQSKALQPVDQGKIEQGLK